MMALPGQDGGYSLLLLFLAFMSGVTGEILLIHEGGKGATWGYSHLPSTFPLTWSQARSACEAIPGSMLARVDGWQAEEAVEEYLREAAFTEPLWLANRQTLPEVLEDEQREMNHVGNAGMLGNDLNMGGDVGVTLRCAVYHVGVGLVHELCSEAAVSAALCVQRLSNERPLLKACPASPHRQWLLVNSHTETTTSDPQQQTTVSVTGLQQCRHHHHHRHLTRAACHPQEGWEATTCTLEASPSQPQEKVKQSRPGYRQYGRVSSSRKTPPLLTPSDIRNHDYERGLEEKEYLFLPPQQENTRYKRSAESKSTEEVQTSHVTSPHIHSITETIPTHRSIVEDHESDVDDKVMLYITGYKKSKTDHEKHNQDEISPQPTARPQTQNEKHDSDPRQHDASAIRVKDKDANKAKNEDEIVFDSTINEIEPEADSGHFGDTPGHPKKNHSAVYYGENEQVIEVHVRPSSSQASNPSKGQGNEQMKDQTKPSPKDTGTTIKVGVGPIFVHGPENQSETNTERNSRALIFPEDSTVTNSHENLLPDGGKEPAIESSSEGSTSGKQENTPSRERTTTPSRPIVFPETENDDPFPEKTVHDDALLNESAENETKSAAHPTREPTLSGANSDVAPDVQSNTQGRNESNVVATTESSPVGVGQGVTDKENTKNTPEMMNDSDNNNDGKTEDDDTQEGSEDPDTNTPASEETTVNPITPDMTQVPLVTTEKSNSRNTPLLIVQIFKSIFG